MGKLQTTKAKPVWQINGVNSVLPADDFWISFNDSSQNAHSPFTALGNMLGGGLEDGVETALVLRGEPTIYKILTGDWRKDYEKLWPDPDACLKFFENKKKKHGNNWSTLPEDRPRDNFKDSK